MREKTKASKDSVRKASLTVHQNRSTKCQFVNPPFIAFILSVLGVCDVAEYPKHLSSAVYSSPKAALMYDCDGFLYSAGEPLDHNCRPRDLQEWWAEADLEKRTLHFFIDGVQQQYHFINIHVPLVFAI